MVIDSMNTVFYTFSFLVPGYIIEEIMSNMKPLKSEKDSARILRCLVYSVVNYVTWFSWGLRILGMYFESDTVVYWVIIVAATLITAVVTGFIMGLIRGSDLLYKLFRWILKNTSINFRHPIPTAWEYIFNDVMSDGAWVVIRMDNGKFIRGLYYTKSFSSSDEEYRDIYLEEVYKSENGKKWKAIPGSKGIWINPDAIRHIEFLDINKEDY